ncbi:MAG: hypothetical protein MUE84_07330 [Hyphomonas sp.]|nr:hypothetical protein [Hyphomonas sp.]
MPDEAISAGAIYTARMLADRAARGSAALGIGDIARFVHDPTFRLTHAQTGELFRNPALREALTAMKLALASHSLPLLAAAADDHAVAERSFAGGTLRVRPSRTATQSYIIFRFAAHARPSGAFVVLVETQDGAIEKAGFPPCDDEGEVMRLFDHALPEDRAFLEALGNPNAEGTIIPISIDP